MKLYEQRTFEGCLPACLFREMGKGITSGKEIESIVHCLKLGKTDYALGVLDFFAKKYKKNITMIVENKAYANILDSINRDRRLHIFNEKVSTKIIDKYLTRGSVIVLIDSYCLWSYVHGMHFVIVTGRKSKKYRIFDPWDGKEKFVQASSISKGIKDLRNRLLCSPKLIQVEKK